MRDILHRLIIGIAGGLLAAHLLAPALPVWARNDTFGALAGTYAVGELLHALHLNHMTSRATVLGISSAMLALWPSLFVAGSPLRRVLYPGGAVLGAMMVWTWGLLAGPQWSLLDQVALEQRPVLAALAGMVVGALLVRALLSLLITTFLWHGTLTRILPQTLLLTTLTGAAYGAHLPVLAVLPGALAWGQALYLLIPPPGGWRIGLLRRRAPLVLAPRGAVWWTHGLVLVALVVSGWLLMQPI